MVPLGTQGVEGQWWLWVLGVRRARWWMAQRNLKVQRLSAGAEQLWDQELFLVAAVLWVVALPAAPPEFPKVSEC